MIVEPDRKSGPGTLTKAARAPRIKGDTLKEKAESFSGKRDAYERKKREVLGLSRRDEAPIEALPREKPAFVPMIQAAPKPKELIKLGDHVPASIKAYGQRRLAEVWTQAKAIWGDRIGDLPVLQLDLQARDILGCCYPQTGVIKLDALFCIVATNNLELRKEMFEDTLVHEIAHLINWRFAEGKGHDSGWEMAMKLLGFPPDIVYTGSGLPNWAAAYQAEADKIRKGIEGANGEAKELPLNDGAQI